MKHQPTSQGALTAQHHMQLLLNSDIAGILQSILLLIVILQCRKRALRELYCVFTHTPFVDCLQGLDDCCVILHRLFASRKQCQLRKALAVISLIPLLNLGRKISARVGRILRECRQRYEE